MSGSGISWAICKSAPRSRQITTLATHHSVFLQAGCPSCRPTNSVKALKAASTEGSIPMWQYNGFCGNTGKQSIKKWCQQLCIINLLHKCPTVHSIHLPFLLQVLLQMNLTQSLNAKTMFDQVYGIAYSANSNSHTVYWRVLNVQKNYFMWQYNGFCIESE